MRIAASTVASMILVFDARGTATAHEHVTNIPELLRVTNRLSPLSLRARIA